MEARRFCTHSFGDVDMPLTAKKVDSLKPKEKLYRVADARGLCIEVKINGAKFWRFRYRYAGKAKMISLGKYPIVSLKEARKRRKDAQGILDEGGNPANERRTQRPALDSVTFETVAREWLDVFSKEWTDKTHRTNKGRLKLHTFPYIGNMPIAEISAQDMLRLVQRIQAQGAVEMARRVRVACSQVFRYAIPQGLVDRDPAADVRGVLPPVSKTLKHHASITAPAKVGELMRAIYGSEGTLVVKLALQMVAYTFVRSGELRGATWSEVDLDHKEWRIPPERMKTGRPHIVPLSRQVVKILEYAQELRRGGPGYVFPGIRTASRMLSENTLNVALRRIGYTKEEMTCHGFRATATTLLYENGWPDEAVERQLAHIQTNSVRAAYDHAKHMEKRREMMQWYADHLDGLRDAKC